VNTNTGPAWLPDGTTPGIGARAETRFSQSDYTGNATSAEQYLLESVVQPNVFVVDGYAEGIMPGTYSSTLSAQDAADLIAYMLSIR
jgi:cytochrome c